MGRVYLFGSGSPPPPRLCVICKTAISETAELRFCDTHHTEFEERRRKGVATQDLDTRWHDRLVDWRERPAVLDGEAQPELFYLGRRVGPWLTFSRGYPSSTPPSPGTSRLPDWITVNAMTNEVRRFVDIDQYDLWDDLEGIRPAPDQEGLAEGWGRPEARRPRKDYRDGSGAYSVSAMIQDALITVYGVFRNPLGIRLCGTGHGGSVGRGPTRVSLRFSSGDVLDPQIIVSLSSERANDRRIKHPPGYGSSPIPELALALLKEYKRELWEQSRQVSPQSITRHIVVPGFEPATELIHWGEPINLFNFALKNEEIILSVSAQGLSENELFQLISHLGVVNHNPELLAQYQVEFDQVRQAQLGP